MNAAGNGGEVAGQSTEITAAARPWWQWSLAIFLLALALRLLHLAFASRVDFFALRVGDAESYHLWAKTIAAGNWWGDEVFYQAPLYPYFLATIYTVFGDGVGTVRFLQAMLGSLSCVFLANAGRRWFGRPEGLAAGWLLAGYAPAIFFDSLIDKSVLDSFFLTAALWVLGEIQAAGSSGRHGNRLLLLAGGLFGCLMLTRENTAVLVIAAVAWLACTTAGWRGRLWSSGSLVAGLLAVLLPVGFRNYSIGGEFHLTTSQFGPNLYIGNHAGATGLYEPLVKNRSHWRFERQDAEAIAEKAAGRELTPGEVSRHFVGEVGRFIAVRPGAWLRLLGKKTALTWNAVETVDTIDQYTLAEFSWPLRLSGFVLHFGVLLPLAVLGLWMTAGRWRQLWLLYAMIGLYAASVIAFYVFARYRFPLVPLLSLFAGAGIAGCRDFLEWRPRWRMVGGSAVVALVAVCGNWPLVSVAEMQATTYFNIGAMQDAAGNIESAIRAFDRSLELQPHADTFYSRGRLHFHRGSLEKAEKDLLRALEMQPQSAESHLLLGQILDGLGRTDAARQSIIRAIELQPDFAAAHAGLGAWHLQHGDFAAAEASLGEAIRLNEKLAEAWSNLGLVFLKRKEFAPAAKHFQRAIELAPNFAKAHHNLGLALDQQDDFAGAERAYRAALELDPEFAAAENDLGMLLGRQGKMAEAAECFRRAIRADSRYATAHFNLGLVMLNTGQLPQAAVHFQRALDLNPGLEVARQQLQAIREAMEQGPKFPPQDSSSP